MKSIENHFPAIEALTKELGGVVNTATALEVSKGLVYLWLSGERTFPAAKCPRAERLTQGRVRCDDLRPDVEWQYIRETFKEPMLGAATEPSAALGLQIHPAILEPTSFGGIADSQAAVQGA